MNEVPSSPNYIRLYVLVLLVLLALSQAVRSRFPSIPAATPDGEPLRSLAPTNDPVDGGLERERANPAVLQASSPFRFTEIAREAGIDFVHFSGMTADKHFPTANGSGRGHLRL